MIGQVLEGSLDPVFPDPPAEHAVGRPIGQARPESRLCQQCIVRDNVAAQEVARLDQQAINVSCSHPRHVPVSQSCGTRKSLPLQLQV